MEQNRDGTFLFKREELLNDNIIVASKVYPLSEHQFYVLTENGDTRADIFAGRVLIYTSALMRGRFGCHVPKCVWYTVEVIEPSVIYETKDGKYGEYGSEGYEK